jgi:hypothetical protein
MSKLLIKSVNYFFCEAVTNPAITPIKIMIGMNKPLRYYQNKTLMKKNQHPDNNNTNLTPFTENLISYSYKNNLSYPTDLVRFP